VVSQLPKAGPEGQAWREELHAALLQVAKGLSGASSVSELLRAGLDVEVRDDAGKTPLLLAASRGERELVELFLNHGSRLDAVDSTGANASYLAFIHEPSLMKNDAFWTLVQPDGFQYSKPTWDAKPPSAVGAWNDDNFDNEVLGSSEMVLAEFYAPWCAVCKKFQDEWLKAAANLQGFAKMGAVDATENTALAARFNVSFFPTIKVWRAGPKGNQGEDNGPYLYNRALDATEVYRFVMEEMSKPRRPANKGPPSARRSAENTAEPDAPDTPTTRYDEL